MKIALFDGIVETHVGTSLERALIASGHEVFNTGKIGHGYSFASDESSLRIIENALNQVLDFRPDVIFVFRPGSLPFPLLKRAKASGATLVAWFSDDPVLWNLSYGPIIDSYDLVLHCGTARVLDFYEKVHGRPTGVNFPFWTDEVAFPYVYGKGPRESDAIFLGNVHDEVRRQRYFDLGSLESSLRIYGSVGRDYFGIWGGYLDSDAEVVEAGGRAGAAVNIPQYFRDHRGLDTWFDGLDELGFFQYPSRVIQYAAMGLPIISVVPDEKDLSTFPEIQCVSSMRELDVAIKDLATTDAAAVLSRATHERFRRNFSATSRVMALEKLLVDDSWRGLDAVDRSIWFSQFDGMDQSAKVGSSFTPAQTGPVTTTPSPLHESPPLRLVLLGSSNDRVTSISSVAIRVFARLGHEVRSVDVERELDVLSEGSISGHKYSFDADRFFRRFVGDVDVLVLAGLDCDLPSRDVDALRAVGIRMVYLGCPAAKHDRWLDTMAERVNYLGLLNSEVADKMVRSGHRNTEYLPYLVDEAFKSALESELATSDGVVVTGHRKLHFSNQAQAFKDVVGLPVTTLYLEDNDAVFKDLGALAKSLKTTMTIVPYDSSMAGPLPSEVLPFVLASGALTVVPRGIGPMNIGTPGVESVVVRERGELALKLSDLLKSPSRIDDILKAASSLVSNELNAEVRLTRMLREVQLRGEINANNDGPAATANEMIGFDARSSSFIGEWKSASAYGTIIDLEIWPADPRSAVDPVTVEVSVDGLCIYTELISAGQKPSRLSVHVVPGNDKFVVRIRQTLVNKNGKSQVVRKPLIQIGSVEVKRPNAKIESVKVRTSSVWALTL